jgi:hypothetical protein
MSTFTLENFRAEVLARGMAKPNRFEVVVIAPRCVNKTSNVRLVSMMAENCQLPMSRINTSQQRIFGPPTQHPHFAEYGGESMSVQFYLDREMTVKTFFDDWINGVVDPVANTAYYQDNYLSTGMTIAQLDEQDQNMYKVKFIDLYPIAVNPVQLDHNQGNTVSRLNVTFTYRRWQNAAITDAAPQPVRTLSKPNAPPVATPGPKRVNYTGQEVETANDYGQSFGVGQLSG